MVYCAPTDVRSICDIDADDMQNSDMSKIIASATVRLNGDINTIIYEEKAEYIDSYRTNKKDGSNKDFYVFLGVNNEYYIGDYDNDGTIDESDGVVWVYDGTTHTRTEATISSVDHASGKFSLESAPTSNQHIFITWARAPIDESTPNAAIKEACKVLSASLAYMKLRGSDYQKMALGDLSLHDYSGSVSSRSFGLYKTYYEELVDDILAWKYCKGSNIAPIPYLSHVEGLWLS